MEEEQKLKRSLKIEEEVFREKLNPELESFVFGDVTEIKGKCDKLNLPLGEYFKLLNKIKNVFEDELKIALVKSTLL